MWVDFLTVDNAEKIGLFAGVLYGAFKVSRVSRSLGKKNGKGDVVALSEEMDAKLDKLLQRQGVLEDKLDFTSDLLLKHISTPGAHGGSTRDPFLDWDPARR